MRLIFERIGITNNSTLRLKEKREERGSCHPLYKIVFLQKGFLFTEKALTNFLRKISFGESSGN